MRKKWSLQKIKPNLPKKWYMVYEKIRLKKHLQIRHLKQLKMNGLTRNNRNLKGEHLKEWPPKKNVVFTKSLRNLGFSLE